MQINEDGRWGTLKLSNTFQPRSLQGPEHAGSGCVRLIPGFSGREQPVSPTGNNSWHLTVEITWWHFGDTTGHASRATHTQKGWSPQTRWEQCLVWGAISTRICREEGRGGGTQARRHGRPCWDGHRAAAASRAAVSTSEPAPGAAMLRRA